MMMIRLPETNLLETENLLLKEITPELYDVLFKKLDDNALMAYMGIPTAEALIVEKEKAAAGLCTYHIQFKTFVITEKNSGKAIGRAGFHNWYTRHNRAEVGYIMTDDNYKQKGLMKEALKAIFVYGFEQMHLQRVEALISPSNTPSVKLANYYGFTNEGLLRQHYFINDKYEDSAFYSLLKHDYDKLKNGW